MFHSIPGGRRGGGAKWSEPFHITWIGCNKCKISNTGYFADWKERLQADVPWDTQHIQNFDQCRPIVTRSQLNAVTKAKLSLAPEPGSAELRHLQNCAIDVWNRYRRVGGEQDAETAAVEAVVVATEAAVEPVAATEAAVEVPATRMEAAMVATEERDDQLQLVQPDLVETNEFFVHDQGRPSTFSPGIMGLPLAPSPAAPDVMIPRTSSPHRAAAPV
jgi:hypothetical protein